jgi:RNA polymerase sigma-70 factor (ECF subfamily)
VPEASGASIADAVAAAHADEWGRIVATLIRVTGDWSLAEDCAQDAFATALERWPRDGVPPNPGGWLTTVAKNRAIDRLRRSANERVKLAEAVRLTESVTMDELQEPTDDEPADDRLRLIFTCCHPALTPEARVALTLRTVAGLTTGEIAHAFLVPEPTMAQRLVRAKSKIRNAGIPYRVPEGRLLGERLPGVLAVLYLLFNEGYSASSGESLVRTDLAAEAIRVARLLVQLMPDEAEAAGLLALMLLQHSRRAARTDAEGELVPLEEQNRDLWDAGMIAEGVDILQTALRRERAGRYQLQAIIAAEYATAPSLAETNFAELLHAWDELVRLDRSPVVALNRAIAWGMWKGASEGLAAIDRVASGLDGYYLLPAARADFLRRLGRTADALAQYRAALALAPTAPERRYLERRLEQLGTGQLNTAATPEP